MFTLQGTSQLVRELRDGALDAAFLLASVDDDALAFQRVFEIELVVAVPKDHPRTCSPFSRSSASSPRSVVRG